VHIARGEQFLLTRRDPLFASGGLTFWAVAIAAAVIGDGGTMPATGALIDMTAECSSTTARNGQRHFDMLPADPLAVSFDEGSSGAADDIGHLEWWPAHRLYLRWLALERQGVQGTRGRVQLTL